ncbi:nuclease-related domain-containing protein [Nonomuraea sp. NPDC050478]|uniref:nuclease-related domain-containing protein n=1 Tax=Nonomuraea sp. NPDC050478 TaxID=3364365 RepID=UPI0037AF7491
MRTRRWASWRNGAAGQPATARRLRTLELAGYTVLHDLAIPRSNTNIDHLVIGPTGVFVIDSKKGHRRTTIRAASGTLCAPSDKVVRPVLFEARRAGEVLSQAAGRRVEVTPSRYIAPACPASASPGRGGQDLDGAVSVRPWPRSWVIHSTGTSF